MAHLFIIKHQPPQTKGLHALQNPDQFTYLTSQKYCSVFSRVLPSQFCMRGSIDIHYFYERFLLLAVEVSLSSFHAADLIHNKFLSNIFTGNILSDLCPYILGMGQFLSESHCHSWPSSDKGG